VTLEVLDKDGLVVPTASNLVRFKATGAGRLIGLGNGDPSCHEPEKSGKRPAFNGLALAIVQSNGKKGGLTLRAEAQGLKPAILSLKAR